MPFEPLEKLWIWQEAMELHRQIRLVTSGIKSEYRLKDQADRSSQSVADNIAEMYGAYYYNVKINCLRTARREAYETQNHLVKIAMHHNHLEDKCRNLATQYSRLIFGINKYIKSINDKKDQS